MQYASACLQYMKVRRQNMIKLYNNGAEFISENGQLLNLNKYMSTFFFMDAPLLKETNKSNYAIKAEESSRQLLAMKVEPYNLMLYGDKDLLPELLQFISRNGYVMEGVMCPSDIGEYLVDISNNVIGKEYVKSIGMDFMETTKYTEPSSDEVTVPSHDNLDQLYGFYVNFIRDCGLTDKPDRERLEKHLSSFRIVKADGEPVSMAAFSVNTDSSYRITHVYTKPEYRGKGYARKVVNSLKNEILAMGKTATLNVDQANPVSYHLYSSLGFEKVFSQGLFYPKQK